MRPAETSGPPLEVPGLYDTARSTAGLAILSVLSPAAGMAVEMAVATRFGTSAAVDAFRIALAVVYLGQQLFVGSLFPNLIVPLFEEYRARGNETQAWRNAIALANLAAVPTLIISALLLIWPGAVVWLLASGLKPQARRWAILFVRWFALSLIPLLYGGAAASLLYAHKIFWASATAQLSYNLILATSILILGGKLLGPAAMIFGVLLGSGVFLLLQWARVAPLAKKAWRRFAAGRTVERSDVRRRIALGIPLFGLPMINQANAIVAFWSLSAEPVGTIAALGYAGKLLRMGAIVPEAMATVLFPRFAALARATDPGQLGELATRAIRMALFVGLPTAFMLLALRVPLVTLLLRHGAFSENATHRVGLLFGLFMVGMPGTILSVYLAKVLYALEDMWWPTYGALVSVGVAVALMPLAASRFGAEGVAATYAAIFWIGALVQAGVLHSKYRACDARALAIFAIKVAAPAVAAAWLGGMASYLVHDPNSGGTGLLMLALVTGAIVTIGSYWLAALAIGNPEAHEIKRYMQWQTAPVLDMIRISLHG